MRISLKNWTNWTGGFSLLFSSSPSLFIHEVDGEQPNHITNDHNNKKTMEKITIKVPAHVSRISQWAGMQELLPKGQFILNKVFPGCGMTYYYLHSDMPVILCAPRNSLLRNKAEQLDDERMTNDDKRLYTLGGYEMDYYYFSPSTKTNIIERKRENEEKFNWLLNFSKGEDGNPFKQRRFIPKILVTIDSLPSIYPIIKESGLDYLIVDDEFHTLFQDYTLKPDTIERGLRVLEEHPRVCYLSATPILESYLERMESFRDLPYIEFKWPTERVRNTTVFYFPMSSTVKEACRIIEDYRRDGLFTSMTINGKSYNSTEAVFFINNVKTIVDIIQTMQLPPSEVNILVSHEPGNRKLIRRLGPGFDFGSIPIKGRAHKTLTMCSKMAFLGCDFYSTSASTYVFADANIRSMTTDISLDLHQIVGRQRLEENVFKDFCTVFVKTTKGDMLTREEFDRVQREKWELSEFICNDWNGLSQESLSAIMVNTAKCPYGVVYENPITREWISKNSLNAMISEEHAWDLRNRVYKDHETVQHLISSEDFSLNMHEELPPEVFEFYRCFLETRGTADKMCMYCKFFDTYPEFKQYIGQLYYISAEYKNYYEVLGTERIARNQFVLSRIEPEYEAASNREFLSTIYYECFGDGGDFTRADIKTRLKEIYSRYNIPKAAKATDMADYYEMHEIKLTIDGQRVNGFRLTRI